MIPTTPPIPEQPSPEGLDGADCSPSAAFQRFMEIELEKIRKTGILPDYVILGKSPTAPRIRTSLTRRQAQGGARMSGLDGLGWPAEMTAGQQVRACRQYIDSDEYPHEVLASIDESLSDITADAANHNKGSIQARANAAVRMLESLDQCRVVGGDTINRAVTLEFREMPENVTIGDTWWAGFLHNADL